MYTVPTNRNAKGTSETEVCQLQLASAIDQEVLGLEIAARSQSITINQYVQRHRPNLVNTIVNSTTAAV
jgi:hypothetical protein